MRPHGGRLIELGYASVFVVESGSRGVPIVVEAGAGGCGLEWAEVADLLAPRRVIRLDRPGLGFSPYARVRRDAEAAAAMLREVLVAAGVAPPYVLVGHSISGMTCRAFAYHHPTEVAGLVLVDPFDEDTDDSALPRGFEVMQQVGLRAGALLTGIGLRRLVAAGVAAGARRILARPDRPGTDRRLREIADAITSSSSFTAQADAAAAVARSRHQLRVLADQCGFPTVPVRVLTPDSPPANHLERLVRTQNVEQLHPREAAASTLGSHHVVQRSSHLIYIDQPEILADHVAQVAQAGD